MGTEKTPDGHSVPRRLFDQVRNAPPGGACTVEVQRLSARVKASKQARKDSRAARVADVTLRYRKVALPCPGAAAVELGVVHAREEHPPPTTEPLEWFVLTTLPVTSTADATQVLRWYVLRWRIEEYFRVLKSGCKVEELQHHTAERLERAMAIKMVIGWRIQFDGPARARGGLNCRANCCSLMASCACSPPSPARARCRHPRASATPSVWSGASAGGSGAPATRPARNSCGTATPNSSPWPSPSNCVGLQRGEVAPRDRRADGGQLRLGAASRLAGPFGPAVRGRGCPRPAGEHRLGRRQALGVPAHNDDLDGEPGRAQRRPQPACVSPHVRTPLGVTSSAWTNTNVARAASSASGSLCAK